jgi:hypothetical protein
MIKPGSRLRARGIAGGRVVIFGVRDDREWWPFVPEDRGLQDSGERRRTA